MDLFADEPRLRIYRPHFDCIEEYMAVIVSLVGGIGCLINVVFYGRSLVVTKPRTVFILLMFATSAILLFAQIAVLVITMVHFGRGLRWLYNVSIGSGSISYVIAQALGMEVFLPKQYGVRRFTRKIIVAHIVLHVVCVTPLYVNGILFLESNDPGFFAMWFRLASGYWWIWVVVYDMAQSIYIAWTIVTLSKRVVDMTINSEPGTASTASQKADSEANARTIAPLAVVVRAAPLSPNGNETMDPMPTVNTPHSADQPSPMTPLSANLSPMPLVDHEPGHSRSSPTEVDMHVRASTVEHDGLDPSRPSAIGRLAGATTRAIPQAGRSKSRKTRKTTLLNAFRGQFIKTFICLALFAVTDAVGIMLFWEGAFNVREGDVDSLSRRKAFAYLQMGSAGPSFHAALVTLFYSSLATLFSVARTQTNDQEMSAY